MNKAQKLAATAVLAVAGALALESCKTIVVDGGGYNYNTGAAIIIQPGFGWRPAPLNAIISVYGTGYNRNWGYYYSPYGDIWGYNGKYMYNRSNRLYINFGGNRPAYNRGTYHYSAPRRR